MSSPALNNTLITLVGPTAVGKTELSIQLAERIGGEIVSADSRLFYRGMDIGTAKPTREEMERVPHHLIDIMSPNQTCSLAVFQEMATGMIEDIFSRKKIPILVGGTGQYVRSVIEGWQPPEMEANHPLREVLLRWADIIGKEGLHNRLKFLDPEAAIRIDYTNLRRTVRALEVIFSTGQKFSIQRKKGEPLFATRIIGLRRPRPELYERIDQRIENMLAAGLVEEVRHLIQAYPSDLPAFSAIGYCEIILYLRGEITLEEAVVLIKRKTRQFVRRQANWFKESDPQINWMDCGPRTVDEMIRLLSE